MGVNSFFNRWKEHLSALTRQLTSQALREDKGPFFLVAPLASEILTSFQRSYKVIQSCTGDQNAPEMHRVDRKSTLILLV